MNITLAIDPGSTESAWCAIDADQGYRPIDFGKAANDDLLRDLTGLAIGADRIAIEMVASYGMAVGADVFETCVWIGRFEQRIRDCWQTTPLRVKRHPVKLHQCHSARASDANVTQALIDRFAAGAPNRGKGTKAEPGWFHGFAGDIWQAYALAVYVADEGLGQP